ncbi:MAG: hypothetical protein OEX97_12875, partial [Acidimicrobiia bacterium]|nr:hypothetical protein [Acidimicrobiia bacterium]
MSNNDHYGRGPAGAAKQMMEILFSLLRRRWRVLLVLTMLILVLPFVRVRLLPYPAIVSSPPVAWAASSESTWETGVIEAEVSMAGISWTLEPPQEAWVRGRGGDGRWTEWFPIGLSPDHGPDPGTLEAERSARNVSDGVWFEDAEAVQY